MTKAYEYIGRNNSPISDNEKVNEIANKLYYVHGSGLDYIFEYYQKGSLFKLETFYHFMNEDGYYDGSFPIKVIINMNTLEIVSFRCRNYGKYYGIADSVYDTIYNALRH